MKRKSDLSSIAGVARLLAVMAIIGALYLGQGVFVPLTLAVLLAFLLSPIVNRIQRLGTGNVVAVLATAFVAFVILGGTLLLVGRELTSLVTQLPQYKEELVSKARGLAGLGSGMGNQLDDLAEEVTEAIESPVDEAVVVNADSSDSETALEGTSTASTLVGRLTANLFRPAAATKQAKIRDGKTPQTALYTVPVKDSSTAVSWAGTIGGMLGPLGTVGLVTVFVLFLLVYRDDMRDRMIKVLSHGNYVTTTEALREVSRRISKYLLAQTTVNVSYGLVLAMGLYLIGLGLGPDGTFPNFILWGVLATLLRFVPYLGPVIAASFPLLLSFAVFPGYSVPVAVATLIIALELISNNIVEPLLYGASTGLSAIAVIMAAVFWGWLWGPVGLLLSTPLTVCLVVLGRHVPRFRVFSTLLGDSNDVKSWRRFYQRLLSKDFHQAADVLSEEVAQGQPPAAIDSVLVPTLRRIQADHDAEQLSSPDVAALLTQLENVIDEAKWSRVEKAAAEAATPSDREERSLCKVQVTAVAAHSFSEELLLRSFALAVQEVDLQLLDSSLLPKEIAAEVHSQNPDAMLILVLPKGGFEQARFLCREIRQQGYRGIVTVCCCGKFRHFDRLFVKFRRCGANFMTTSLLQTAFTLQALKRPKQVPAPTSLGPEVALTAE